MPDDTARLSQPSWTGSVKIDHSIYPVTLLLPWQHGFGVGVEKKNDFICDACLEVRSYGEDFILASHTVFSREMEMEV